MHTLRWGHPGHHLQRVVDLQRFPGVSRWQRYQRRLSDRNVAQTYYVNKVLKSQGAWMVSGHRTEQTPKGETGAPKSRSSRTSTLAKPNWMHFSNRKTTHITLKAHTRGSGGSTLHFSVTGLECRFTVSSLLKKDDIRGLGVFIMLSSGVLLGGVPACMPLESLACRRAVTACALMLGSREGGDAIMTWCDPACCSDPSSLNDTEGLRCSTCRT
jgi:hypothetical protein